MADNDTPITAPPPVAGNVTPDDPIYQGDATPGDTDEPAVEVEVGEDGEPLEPEVVDDDDELEEVDDDGKKRKVSKALKPKLMMHADYTRKTQEVAEQRRALEEQQANVSQQAQLAQVHAQGIGKLHQAEEQLKSIDNRLKQYDAINWQQVEGADPSRAQTLVREQMQLRGLREQWARYYTETFNEMRGAEQHRLSIAQQAFAKRVEEGKQLLNREIKGGFTEETARTLRTYAQSSGVPEYTITKFQDDPHAVLMLHKAYRYDQIIAKQKAAARTPTPSTPEPRPTPQVGRRSSTSASALSDRQSPEAWVAAREKQLRARRGH